MKTITLPDSTQLTYPKNLFADGDSNTKLRKSGGKGFITLGLSLAPHKSAGVGNLCPNASPGCIEACLDHQGMASVWDSIAIGREKRTKLFYHDRQWFLDRLKVEIGNKLKTADSAGLRLAVRLNVFSDVPWEKIAPSIFSDFPEVEFYDYSKNPKRAGLLLPNYWLTFSRSEINHKDCLNVLRNGGNVAVPFADLSGNYVGNRAGLQTLPATWEGYHVINGDESDLRFQDTRGRKHGRVVGLKLKAHSTVERQQAIASGFAVTC